MDTNTGNWFSNQKKVSDAIQNLDADGQLNSTKAMTTGPGAGITGGSGTICESSIVRNGNLATTQIYIYLDGLKSTATDTDIIGLATGGAAYIGRIDEDESGVIIGVRMQCLQVPTGGDDDVYLYASDKAVGAYDTAMTDASLGTETKLIDGTGTWTLGEVSPMLAVPNTDDYLYLAAGGGDTAVEYTGGKFLIELIGYFA